MADSEHDSLDELNGFRTADEESDTGEDNFPPVGDSTHTSSESVLDTDETFTNDPNATTVYNPDWTDEVVIQYFESKRAQLVQSVVGGRLDPDSALVELDELESEQEQLHLLREVDEFSIRKIRDDLISRKDFNLKMAYTPKDFADSLKTAIKEMADNARPARTKKDHRPPTLSEVSAIQWKTFRQGFELATKYNEWEDAAAVMMLRLSMKEEAARAVEHVTFPDTHTLKEALDDFEKVFVNPSGQDLAEVEFRRAKRKRDETFQAFHIRLRNLFCRAFPSETAEDSKLLKDTYILHLGDPDTSRQLRASTEYRKYKYSEVLTRSQDILAANSLVRQAYPSAGGGGVHELQPPSEPEDSPETVNLIGNGECFHCQQKGHLARDCPIANRVVKRIRENPAAWGFSKLSISGGKNGKGTSHKGKSANHGGGYTPSGSAPSTPLWGRQHVQRNRTGGTSRWRTRRPNRRSEQMAALEENQWDEDTPLPEEVAQLLREEAEEGASGAPDNN